MLKQVYEWVRKDEKLAALINDLKANSDNAEEAALAAYHQVAEMFCLPKKRQDITDELYDEYESLDKEPHAVFEELALINFMEPKADMLDKVLLALYVIYTKEHLDMEQAAIRHFGSKKKIPRPYRVLYYGKDIDARISFNMPSGQTWTADGAVAMIQVGL